MILTMQLTLPGYLMDMKVLQQCIRANVGDLTFEVIKLYLESIKSRYSITG